MSLKIKGAEIDQDVDNQLVNVLTKLLGYGATQKHIRTEIKDLKPL